jgi:hypothetical protein
MVGNINMNVFARFAGHHNRQMGAKTQQTDVKGDPMDTAAVRVDFSGMAAWSQGAGMFASLFFANFNRLGIREAFDEAWAAVQARLPENIGGPGSLKNLLRNEIESISMLSDTEKDDLIENIRMLAIMAIAMRIANGDNVPQRDYEFLMKHDEGLYREALKARAASMNDDPVDYGSVADAFEEIEKAIKNPADDAKVLLGFFKYRPWTVKI